MNRMGLIYTAVCSQYFGFDILFDDRGEDFCVRDTACSRVLYPPCHGEEAARTAVRTPVDEASHAPIVVHGKKGSRCHSATLTAHPTNNALRATGSMGGGSLYIGGQYKGKLL